MRIRNLSILHILSVLVSAITIVGISILIKPVNAGVDFWYRVIWVEILNILFWYSSKGWFCDDRRSTDAAITPLNNNITTIYCIVSFFSMLLFAKVENSTSFNKWHLVIQLFLLALYILLILRIQLAAHFNDKGVVNSKNIITEESPLVIADKIKMIEKRVNSVDIKQELKTLREKLAYSLQDTLKTRSNMEYINLISDIRKTIFNQDNISIKNLIELQISVDIIAKSIKRI